MYSDNEIFLLTKSYLFVYLNTKVIIISLLKNNNIRLVIQEIDNLRLLNY